MEQNDHLEARIRELERAAPREVINVDAAAENTMVVFSAIEELRKDTEDGWKNSRSLWTKSSRLTMPRT